MPPMMTGGYGYGGGGCPSCGPGPMSVPSMAPTPTPTPAPASASTMYNPAPSVQGASGVMMDAHTQVAAPARF